MYVLFGCCIRLTVPVRIIFVFISPNNVRRQKHRSRQLYINENNVLQQFQMEGCQPIKRLKDKKKRRGGRRRGMFGEW
jgi:hypothetical protein